MALLITTMSEGGIDNFRPKDFKIETATPPFDSPPQPPVPVKERNPHLEVYEAFRRADSSHHQRSDAHFVNPSQRAVGVFHGIDSGKGDGDSALRAALKAKHEISVALEKTLSPELTAKQIEELLQKTISEAHRNFTGENEGFMTSFALAVMSSDNKKMVSAWAGNARIFLLPRNQNGGFGSVESLRMITTDDNTITKDFTGGRKEGESEQERQGRITAEHRRIILQQLVDDYPTPSSTTSIDPTITADLVRSYFNRRLNVTNALGIVEEDGIPRDAEEVVHTEIIAVNPGDRILVFTNGLSDNLTRTEIWRIVAYLDDPINVPGALMRAVNERIASLHPEQNGLNGSSSINPRARDVDVSVLAFDTPPRLEPVHLKEGKEGRSF